MSRPALYLEYMSLENLINQHDVTHFSYDECAVILFQSLSVLEYLHGQSQSIVHRDIKSKNIFVQYRDIDSLCIKLSDFGLFKIDDQLKTFCDSKTFCFFEIRDDAEPYTKAVNIWSLDVVVLRFAYNLPYFEFEMKFKWCQKIVEEINDWNSKNLIDILQRMFIIEFEARCSTNAGWKKASALVASFQDRLATLTSTFYAADYRTMTLLISEGRRGQEQETLILSCEITVCFHAISSFEKKCYQIDWFFSNTLLQMTTKLISKIDDISDSTLRILWQNATFNHLRYSMKDVASAASFSAFEKWNLSSK